MSCYNQVVAIELVAHLFQSSHTLLYI